jgi:hypothetical protein
VELQNSRCGEPLQYACRLLEVVVHAGSFKGDAKHE